ncbi:hypothetical protein DL98DRAFT_520515 [Cadophora sp. DSE1049]|nr:hypothetical protein DL98DRAFT_520515 [Cadophora sp. DSE1049]
MVMVGKEDAGLAAGSRAKTWDPFQGHASERSTALFYARRRPILNVTSLPQPCTMFQYKQNHRYSFDRHRGFPSSPSDRPISFVRLEHLSPFRALPHHFHLLCWKPGIRPMTRESSCGSPFANAARLKARSCSSFISIYGNVTRSFFASIALRSSPRNPPVFPWE